MTTSRILTAADLLTGADTLPTIVINFAGQNVTAVVTDGTQVTANLIIFDLKDTEGNDIPWSLALHPSEGVEVLYV